MIGNADTLRMVVECARPHLDPTRGPRSHWPPHPLGPGCLIRGCTHSLGQQIATTIDDVSIVCPTCGEYDVASAVVATGHLQKLGPEQRRDALDQAKRSAHPGARPMITDYLLSAELLARLGT